MQDSLTRYKVRRKMTLLKPVVMRSLFPVDRDGLALCVYSV